MVAPFNKNSFTNKRETPEISQIFELVKSLKLEKEDLVDQNSEILEKVH